MADEPQPDPVLTPEPDLTPDDPYTEQMLAACAAASHQTMSEDELFGSIEADQRTKVDTLLELLRTGALSPVGNATNRYRFVPEADRQGPPVSDHAPEPLSDQTKFVQ